MESFWSVIICNYKYEVISVMSSQGFDPRITEGDYLASMIVAEDLPRFLDLMKMLNLGSPSFGHEMSIIDQKHNYYLMQVGGFPTEEGIYIVMYRNYLELYEELMLINNEQATVMRLKLKAAFSMPPEYESLTSINNELLNTQRELHKNKLMIENLLDEKEQLNKSLLESNQLKNQLLGVIGHDLRTPLGYIISYLQLVSDYLDCEEVDLEMRHLSTSIIGSAKQALKVLENLVVWSKANERGIELQYDSFLIDEVIEKVIQLEQLSLREKHIEIQRFNQGNDTLIWSDSNVLAIIIRNVLTNAIKYSHRNGLIEIKSEILCAKSNQCTVNIVVKDYGQGIEESEIERINKGYIGYSKKGTMGEKGSGLGLSITRQMAILLGGKISIESTAKDGTTVFISFEALKKEDVSIR